MQAENVFHIFRAYDIRGIYGKDLTPETAERIGKAFGTFIGERKVIVIGNDPRISSNELKKSLIQGIISTGCNVIDIGLVTIPIVGFTIIHNNLSGGVMITASHNPKEWNGFVLMGEKAFYCSEGMGMERIRENFQSNDFKITDLIGKVIEKNFLEDYKKFVLDKIKINKRLKVVIDAGNGSASKIASNIFKRAGCEVVAINDSPNGNFPAHEPDVTEEYLPELKEKVVEEKADFGFGFDCDADRVGFVDDKGRYGWSGNVTIPIFADYYLKKEPGAKIVFDVTCSSFLEEFIKSKKGTPVINRVGHAFIVNKMMEENAIFGGEYSNHFYFRELFGLDDAIFAALKMTEILSNCRENFSELIDKIPKYPSTKVEEISCPDEIKFKVVERIKGKVTDALRTLDIDGLKVYTEDGWFLIRASNTKPTIKINAEAKTEAKAKELHDFAKKLTTEEISIYENINN